LLLGKTAKSPGVSPGCSGIFRKLVREKELGTTRPVSVLSGSQHQFPFLTFNFDLSGPIKFVTQFPMNWLPRTFAPGRPAAAGGSGSHVVPVRDVQWGRPVFRPPELPVCPRLFDTVPFTAMRPVRPTRRGKFELSF
jgi:hypothetical protein